jgi:hypothetical protein
LCYLHTERKRTSQHAYHPAQLHTDYNTECCTGTGQAAKTGGTISRARVSRVAQGPCMQAEPVRLCCDRSARRLW